MPGPNASTYALGSWFFLRLLGLIYLAAFLSLAGQIKGLIGERGILPAAPFLSSRRRWGRARFWRIPTLCWIDSSDRFLLFLVWSGVVLSALLTVGVASFLALPLLWLFYLSLFSVCRIFLSYQWDILLLETGFLAIFLAPVELWSTPTKAIAPSPLIVWLFWWLLFRLMFSSGVVKLRSGDCSWRKLTALCHHYETQPLPTPLAWYAHQLPVGWHKISTAVLLAIELVSPFLILAPSPGRYLAAALFILLMLLIQGTGNYGFFNLLGISLCVLLLDDGFLLSIGQHAGATIEAAPGPSQRQGWMLALFCLIMVLSVAPMLRLFRFDIAWPGFLAGIFEGLERLRLVNSYGLFSVMTTERPEIVVEGSRDGTHWEAYEFRWKPGDIRRAPRFVAPHQPRLDWQMWFAALSFYINNPWFVRFLERLLEGSPEVLALLRTNPFGQTPPRYVRAVLYDYRFTDRQLRKTTAAWWRRERRDLYSPVLESKN